MSYIVVDVEADGNLIGTNSMVCFGAVIIDKEGKIVTPNSILPIIEGTFLLRNITKNRYKGEVVRIIGHKNDPGVDILSII